jgi:hypothetical protein
MEKTNLRPEEEGKLFVGGGLDNKSAFILPTNVLTPLSIAEGFARVAEIAVANCDRLERQRIAFPVVFCLRHAVEVSLKFARDVARRLFGIPTDPRKRLDHGIWEIWIELRPLIQRCWPKGPNQDLQAIEAMIKELDEKDRNAQRFRFATSNRDGAPHFLTGMDIDLANFCHSGRKILGFLEGCSDGMSETIAAQDPYERNNE